MIKAMLFLFIAVVIIMGGATVLLKTAKVPKIPKNIKTPEQLDYEEKKYDE